MTYYKDNDPIPVPGYLHDDSAPGPKLFAKLMRQIASGSDTEACHCDADDLMLKLLRDLGYGEACDIFEAMPRWYA